MEGGGVTMETRIAHRHWIAVVFATLLLNACSDNRPARSEPIRVNVRLAASSHAQRVPLSRFVWPTSGPTEAVGEAECAWWVGKDARKDWVEQGLNKGTLRFGTVVMTRSELSFLGQPVSAVSADGGFASELLDGDILTPLTRMLREQRDTLDRWTEHCGASDRESPLLAVDESLPASSLAVLLKTLEEQRFVRVAAWVDDRDGELASPEVEESGEMVIAIPEGMNVTLMDSRAFRRFSGPQKESNVLLHQVMEGERVGCALVAPDRQSSWNQVIATVDTMAASGSRRSMMFLRDTGSSATLPALTVKTPSEWLSPRSVAGVHWLDTPTVTMAVGMADEPVRCADVTGIARKQITLPLSAQMAIGKPVPGVCYGDACMQVQDPRGLALHAHTMVAVRMHSRGGVKAVQIPGDRSSAWEECTAASTGRAVGWLQVAPSGAVSHPLVGGVGATDPAWVECLSAVWTQWPPAAAGPPGEYRYLEFLAEIEDLSK